MTIFPEKNISRDSTFRVKKRESSKKGLPRRQTVQETPGRTGRDSDHCFVSYVTWYVLIIDIQIDSQIDRQIYRPIKEQCLTCSLLVVLLRIHTAEGNQELVGREGWCRNTDTDTGAFTMTIMTYSLIIDKFKIEETEFQLQTRKKILGKLLFCAQVQISNTKKYQEF